MITEERVDELQDLFWSETNEDWTQEWRDDLTDEEEFLVKKWDRDYTQSTLKLCEQILEHQKK